MTAVVGYSEKRVAHPIERAAMTIERAAGVLGGSEEDWAQYDVDLEELYQDDFQRKYFTPVKGQKLKQRVKEELARDQGTETKNKKHHHMARCFICYRPIPEGIPAVVYKRDRIFPFDKSVGRMCPEHKEGVALPVKVKPKKKSVELTPEEEFEATKNAHTSTEITEAIKAAKEAKAKAER